jgi:phage protein D
VADQDHGMSTVISIYCGTSLKDVQDEMIQGAVVDLDVDQPDMAVLTLSNQENRVSNEVKLGDSVEVKFSGTSVFKGEVVGLEPMFRNRGPSLCVVRAFNRMHRLLRGRKTRTFTNKKDSDIAKLIAEECKLKIEVEDTGSVRDHVWQHNQTDLELIRILAARNGFEVVVDGETLYFRKPQTVAATPIELRMNDPGGKEGEEHSWAGVDSFVPRLSSAGLVNAVEVRAWNPIEKKEVVGRSKEVSSSKLGLRVAHKNAEVFGEVVTFSVDHPVASPEEAENLANARLGDILMSYIVGDVMTDGSPAIKPGGVIYITINPDKQDDRFNGGYRVFGVTHRFSRSQEGSSAAGSASSGGGGGYKTGVRVQRDAEGGTGFSGGGGAS